MKMVILKLIKLAFILSALTSSIAFADFAANQVRYVSHEDVYLKLIEDLGKGVKGLLEKNRSTGSAYGYQSPETGKALSQKPNFNFINRYLQDLNSLLESVYDKEILYTEELADRVFRLSYDDFTTVDQNILKDVIKNQIIKLIGPESVVKSYGHISSMDKFVEMIYQTAKAETEKLDDKNVRAFAKNVIKYICLRDEYLSY